MKCFPEKVPRATDGSESAVLASWAAEDIAEGEGGGLLVWHAAPSSLHDRCPKRGSKDAGREATNEQVRRIGEYDCTVAGAHIVEGRTVLVVSGPPEDNPGAGR